MFSIFLWAHDRLLRILKTENLSFVMLKLKKDEEKLITKKVL